MKKIINAEGLIEPKHLDKFAIYVIKTLKQKGFEAFLVGGCIRDLLSNKKPKDFDIVTSATPQQVRKIFRNSQIIGKRFKINHVYGYQHKVYEVSTFRRTPQRHKDGDLLLKRDNYYGTMDDDVMRRDFTVNSLYFDPDKNEIYDYTGGFEDIKNKILKMIGDPSIRIKEDPVRILRAIRLSSKLNFKIEETLYRSLSIYASELKKSSIRRVKDEMWKIFMGENARKSFELLVTTGVLNVIFKDYAKLFEEKADKETFYKSLEFIDLISYHPIFSKIIVIPLYIQFLFWDFIYNSPNSKPISFDEFNDFFRENINEVLINLGVTKKQANIVKDIIYILNLKRSPVQNIKIQKKFLKRRHFNEAYFAWQVLWSIRGKHDFFDLNFLLNYTPPPQNKPKKSKFYKSKNFKPKHKKSYYKRKSS